MTKRNIAGIACGLFLGLICSAAPPAGIFTARDYVGALKKVTDVMVNDATSPVAASRYYGYITLAANEALCAFGKSSFSFHGKLKGYELTSLHSNPAETAEPSVTAVYTLIRMGERMLPSGYMLKNQADSILILAAKRGASENTVKQSKELGESVIHDVLTYANSDGFRNLSGYPRYTPFEGDGMWQPTGPVFMAALEPHWSRVRPFILDSAQQFRPGEPASFDTVGTSSFFRQLHDVYMAGKNLSKEQGNIAMFWDCNPFAVQQMGHVEFGLKKISPGGHWMGITGIACLKSKKDLAQTSLIHTLVAITLTDAFISCWDEKYRSNRIRPETAINRWIDPRWRPLLQTPPFPEYTSGHSVISTAAAVMLTKLFGDGFSFTDDSEEEFGLRPRKFKSFYHAADEAAISRFYGGIHYKDAIENGQHQGRKLGQFIIQQLDL